MVLTLRHTIKIELVLFGDLEMEGFKLFKTRYVNILREMELLDLHLISSQGYWWTSRVESFLSNMG